MLPIPAIPSQVTISLETELRQSKNTPRVSGVFFHLKYVVIFGLPSIFARFDNMDPLPGPICISRVTLFSKAGPHLKMASFGSVTSDITGLARVRPWSVPVLQAVHLRAHLRSYLLTTAKGLRSSGLLFLRPSLAWRLSPQYREFSPQLDPFK